MAHHLFNPCDPCCCKCRDIDGNKVGFEEDAITEVVNAGPPYDTVTNIFTGSGWTGDDLWTCAAIFIGPSNECRGINLPTKYWRYLKCYLRCGGRIYLAGEYDGCFAGYTDANKFLTYVGSAMQLDPAKCDCTCDYTRWTGVLNTSVPMLNGIYSIYHACTSFVTGGTWLANINGGAFSGGSCDPQEGAFIAMEKIGNGYLMVAGDSNLTCCCSGYDNSPLWRAFIENEDVNML